jgi:hypothetical protein
MTLAQLIEWIMNDDPDRRLTLRDLEARAAARGHALPHTHIHKLRRFGIVRLPADKTISALAAALGVEVRVIRFAALRSIGWNVTQPCHDRGGCVIISAESLTDQEIEQVRDSAERTKQSILERRAREHSPTAG